MRKLLLASIVLPVLALGQSTRIVGPTGTGTATGTAKVTDSNGLQVNVTKAPDDRTVSDLLNALNDTIVIAVAGYSGASATVPAGLSGVFQAEVSYDGGTTYPTDSGWFYAGEYWTHSVTDNTGVGWSRAILVPAGATHVRVRVSNYIGGSATAGLRATVAGTWVSDLSKAPFNSTVQPPVAQQIGGWTTGNVFKAAGAATQGQIFTNPYGLDKGATSAAGSTVSNVDGDHNALDVWVHGLPLGFNDNNNTTVQTLTANSTYTGTSTSVSKWGQVTVELYADVASAANGVEIESSSNNTDWDSAYVTSFTPGTAPNAGLMFTMNLQAAYYRVKYKNGAVGQSTFRLYSYLRALPGAAGVVGQGSKTTGQMGNLSQGAVTSSAPSYVDGTTAPLSLDANGSLRVSGSSGGGVAQLQVYDGAAWDNVGIGAETASLSHVPVRIQGTGANVIEPLNTTPGGTEYALPVRTIGGSSASDTTATGTLGALDAAVQVALAGQGSVSVQLTGGLTATVVAEVSSNGGTTWNATPLRAYPSGAAINVPVTSISGVAGQYAIAIPPGASHARVRVSSYTSGSTTANVRAVAADVPFDYQVASDGDTAPSVAALVAGKVTTGSNPTFSNGQGRSVSITGSGGLRVAGATDGTDSIQPRVYDVNTGGGVESVLGASLRKSTGTGSVEAGTSTDPLRIDPTGTTTQPTSDAHTTAAGPLSCRLSDGAAFYSLSLPGQGSTTAGELGPLVQGAVTTSAPTYTTGQTNPLSLQTDGALRVHETGTSTVSGTVTANAGTGSFTVAQATAANLNATVTGTVAATQSGSWSLAANQSVNVAQINGVAPTADNATAGTTNLHTLPAIVETSSTMPARTDGSRAALVVDGKGRVLSRISSPAAWSCTQSGITAKTECKALTASTIHYVTHVVLSNGPTAQTLQVVYGTGTNCGTGETALTSTVYLGVNGGAVIPFDSSPLAPASANAVCCKPSGSTAFSCTLAGYSE